MIEFMTTSFRLLRSIFSAWRRDPEFRSLFILVIITLFGGTVYYSAVEGWSVGPRRPLAIHRDLHLRRSQHNFGIHRRRVEGDFGPQEEKAR